MNRYFYLDMNRYLYRRGRGAHRRVMHLAHYDAFGRIDGAWCGMPNLDTSINVPLGRPRCKRCSKKVAEAASC